MVSDEDEKPSGTGEGDQDWGLGVRPGCSVTQWCRLVLMENVYLNIDWKEVGIPHLGHLWVASSKGREQTNGLRRVCGWCVLGTHGVLMASGCE